MGGFGSVQHMNTVMRNNRAQLGKRKSMFRSKDEYIGKTTEGNFEEFIDYKTASPELLTEIKNQLIRQRKIQNWRNSILFLFILIPSIWFSINLLYSNERSEILIEKSVKTKNLKHENLLFFIQDGDEWLNQGKFENALFQYKKAAEVDSLNYSVQYRICLAYSYLCRYDKLQCEKGKIQLEKTIVLFPDKFELIELKSSY